MTPATKNQFCRDSARSPKTAQSQVYNSFSCHLNLKQLVLSCVLLITVNIVNFLFVNSALNSFLCPYLYRAIFWFESHPLLPDSLSHFKLSYCSDYLFVPLFCLVKSVGGVNFLNFCFFLKPIIFNFSVLDSWSQVLSEWDRDNPLQFPKQLPALVRQGIPEALRGEVWQRLTGASVQQVKKLLRP